MEYVVWFVKKSAEDDFGLSFAIEKQRIFSKRLMYFDLKYCQTRSI